MLLSESVHHGGLVWLEMQKALIWCGLNPVALLHHHYQTQFETPFTTTRLLDVRRIHYPQAFKEKREMNNKIRKPLEKPALIEH
jgi:hypothetical protein